MGITGLRNSRRFAALGFCALMFALIGIASATAKEIQPASALTVDDFFVDYLDIWCGLYGANVNSDAQTWEQYFDHLNDDGFAELSQRLGGDEAKYGHLPG